MATVADVLLALEAIAPSRWAFAFDRVGLQVGDPGRQVERAWITLDASDELIEAAASDGATVIVAHHPLFFEPVSALTPHRRSSRLALRLAELGIAFAAAHTNWDCAPGGVSDALAARLGLEDVRPFGEASDRGRCKVSVFVPAESRESVLDAMAAAGAGDLGQYARCAFWTEGTGTFRGGEGSRPAIGEPGRVESVAENRLETLVPEDRLSAVLSALRSAHPYEEPAFDVVRLAGPGEMPIGRIGRLAQPMSLAEFGSRAAERLRSSPWVWGDGSRLIESVAVAGGAGDSLWPAAVSASADLLVTGEVKHDRAVDASAAGLALIAAGHYATEQPGMEALQGRMAESVPSVQWRLFEPPAGRSGRSLG